MLLQGHVEVLLFVCVHWSFIQVSREYLCQFLKYRHQILRANKARRPLSESVFRFDLSQTVPEKSGGDDLRSNVWQLQVGGSTNSD